jgi:hypothetical protein
MNIMIQPETGESVTCVAVSFDGNQYFRNIPPHRSTANPTGAGVLVNFLKQTHRRALGFEDVTIVFDVGADVLKDIENQSRDMSSSSSGAAPPDSFHAGDLGKQHRDYLAPLYGDRSTGGGRDQIYATFYELLSAPLSEWSSDLKKVMTELTAGRGPFTITGIGRTMEEKKKHLQFSSRGSRAAPFCLQTTRPARDNREDAEVLAVLHAHALADGKAAVLCGFDQDFVSLALVYLARAERMNLEVGRLFVKQHDKYIAESDFIEEYVDVSTLYRALESDATSNSLAGRTELAGFARAIPAGYRALSIVVASAALGRDASPSIAGVSHPVGLGRYDSMAGYVGSLARLATAGELDDGRAIVVDEAAFVRFLLLHHVEKKPAVFIAGYGALGMGERAREIGKLEYVAAEKTMAEASVPNIIGFMPPLIAEDQGKCVVTVLRSLLTDQITIWDNAVVDAPAPFRFRSVVVEVQGAADLVAPTQAEYDAVQGRATVRPAFQLGADGVPQNPRHMDFYFGVDGLGKALLANLKLTNKKEAKARPRKLCRNCYHDDHGDGDCISCGGACITGCKKCKHKAHPGAICTECEIVKCFYRCEQCGHSGAFS